MKTKTVIESDTEKVQAMIPFVPKNEDDNWDWEILDDMTTEELEAFAKKIKTHPSVLRAFVSIVEDMRAAVAHDLKTIWERIDKLEGEV